MNHFLILIAILVGGGIICNLLESKNNGVRKTSETVFGTIASLFISGLIALLCTGASVLLFGLFFWFLDDVAFGFLNLPPKFEYDVLSLLRSVFFWLENAYFMPTFFVLWAIILLVAFKISWIKKKLTWIK